MAISDIKAIAPQFALPFAGLTFVWPFVFRSESELLRLGYSIGVLTFFFYAVWASRTERNAKNTMDATNERPNQTPQTIGTFGPRV